VAADGEAVVGDTETTQLGNGRLGARDQLCR
jgi:hypothetical protein